MLIKKISFGLIMAIIFQNVCAQSQPKKDIIISAEIVGINKIRLENSYCVRIELHNAGDTAINIEVMTCSWEDSWKADYDSIYIVPHECDSNFPELIKVPSKHSVIFYGTVHVWKKDFKNKAFRLGFMDLDLWDFHKQSHIKNVPRIYWSNSLITGNYKEGYILR